MKNVLLLVSLVLLGACGGGGSPARFGSSSTDITSCNVRNDVIFLADGASCEISDETARSYAVSSGLLECSDGMLSYGGSSFQANEEGVSFGDLILVCEQA